MGLATDNGCKFFFYKLGGQILDKKRNGLIAIGVVIILAIIGWLSFYEHWLGTYEAIDSADPVNQLAICKKNDAEVTLVFHRTGCQACKKAEPVIVSNVRKARKAGREIIVIDVAELSEHDLTEIQKEVPAAFINNHVPTPEVVELKPDEMGGWQVTDQSSQTKLDLKTIRQIIKKGGA